MAGNSIYEVGEAQDIAKPVKKPIEPDEYLQDVFFRTRPEIFDFDRQTLDPNPYYKVKYDEETKDKELSDQKYIWAPQNWDKQEPYFVKKHPKPTTIGSVRKVLDLYKIENYPSIHLGDFLVEYNFRTAKTLNDLLRATRYFKVKDRGQRCSVREYKADPENMFWQFYVKGHEKWSDPHPHLVQIKFVEKPNVRDIRKLELKVTCDCGFWQYHGPDFNADTQHYLLGPKKRDKEPGQGKNPNMKNIRDPRRVNLICKHVWAVGQKVLQFAYERNLDTFKEVDDIMGTLMKRGPEKMPEALKEISGWLPATERRKLEPLIKKLEKETSPRRQKMIGQQAISVLEDTLNSKDKGFLQRLLESLLRFLGIKKSSEMTNRRPSVANVLSYYAHEHLR